MPNLARRRKGYLKITIQPGVAAAGIAAVRIEFQLSGSLKWTTKNSMMLRHAVFVYERGYLKNIGCRCLLTDSSLIRFPPHALLNAAVPPPAPDGAPNHLLRLGIVRRRHGSVWPVSLLAAPAPAG